MKNLRVAYTNNERILAIGRVTDIPFVLDKNERIIKNWYYKQPPELESFLIQHPEKEDDILKAFAYWVMIKVIKTSEKQNRYGTLKRELQNFSKKMFKTLKAIAGRIGKNIKKYLCPNPKKIKKEKKYFIEEKKKFKTLKLSEF